MQRSHHPDGTEVAAFYVRTVRAGPFVFVSGTTSLDATGAVVGADAAAQTEATLAKISKALASAGASMDHVVRMTIFITDMTDADAVIAAIAKAVTQPITSSLIGIATLVRPELRVEIETTAVITD